MARRFSTYRIEKTTKKNSSDGGEPSVPIVLITLLDDSDQIISTLELNIVDTDTLYQQIISGQAVNVDNAYIENFSLADLRKQKGLKSNHYLDINGFAATNCVFYSEREMDFTFARFITGEIDFSNTLFLQGGVNFTHSNFGDGEIKFDHATFFQGSANFSNAHFDDGLLSFKNSIFNDSKQRSGRGKSKAGLTSVRGKIILNFEDTSFNEGKIDFTRAHLGSGIITFTNANLNRRDVLFVSSEFNIIRMNFKSVAFKSGKLIFRYANFDRGDMFFDRAVFARGIIDFSATEFQTGRISFNRTEFEKNELIFESSEMEKGRINFKNNIFSAGTIDFNSAQFAAADVLFENVDFGKCNASFSRASFHTLSFQSCQVNGFFNLQLQKCKAVDFSNSVVRDIVDMKPYGFQSDINSLNLSGLLLLGRFHLDWDANNVKDLILDQKTSHRDRSEQFRILKENYRSLGQYDAEDEAYVEFRRSEAKADLASALEQGKFLKRLNAYTVYAFKWLIFDKIGLYATSPVRVLTSMVITYLIFVLIYFLLPFVVDSNIYPSGDYSDNLSQLETAFYHSVVTFLTIGYGDYYPAGIFRWISGFEGFAGLFLISYFTVAFVRKALR